jgi:MFS family permease
MADLWGRKRVILSAVAALGCFALLTAFAGSLQVFALLRFLTGLGIGALMPISIAVATCGAILLLGRWRARFVRV